MAKHLIPCLLLLAAVSCSRKGTVSEHSFNGPSSGENLNRIAFPMGGIGAGMICLEGNGAVSQVSVRNRPELSNEPRIFAAITLKGAENTARVLEGPVPGWKILGKEDAGNGLGYTTYGLPRFQSANFLSRFPFAEVRLKDASLPIEVTITGWSPFIPGESNRSSLPVAAVEYRLKNTGGKDLEALFSFNAENFMPVPAAEEGTKNHIDPTMNGFILASDATADHPEYGGSFAAFIPGERVTVDHCWFRGGWWDPLTMCWKNVAEGLPRDTPPVAEGAPGASIYLPLKLGRGESRTVRLLYCWYVPCSDLRQGNVPATTEPCCEGGCEPNTYSPWYTARFRDIGGLIDYWTAHYDSLKKDTRAFTRAFYSTDLPEEVKEAVSANLSILKSPTVLRQPDGSLWGWEGCHSSSGCCYGSCTHVWNYAQAIPHLFPSLERTLRYTEFLISQDTAGHQTFRSNLPLSPPAHDFHAAADGQLGGIMKAYREWRISGNLQWLEKFWPAIRKSMDFCIRTWDPRHRGILEEPHHNTYDIEFWGPDGMCTSFYLGALKSVTEMGTYLGEDVDLYWDLLEKGTRFMESELFNGEYFIQKVTVEGLDAADPVKASRNMWNVNYSPEALELLKKEGPKYQYADGCLSDGVLGFWMARMCGLDPFFNEDMVASHLRSVFRYNLRKDLSAHVNPQRPGYAMGSEGGLLLCTWPKGDAPSLPFVYSNEVWTGIEYQVASHLMSVGEVEKGLEIVRTCRKRYDGTVRNPFDEYECGYWYARAMSSYGMIQGLTGIRYDAVDSILYIDSRIGNDFRSFLATESGFGNVGLNHGKPFVDFSYGTLPLTRILVSGKEFPAH